MPKYKKLKDAIQESEKLTDAEKTQSVQHIEEWITQDKAFGLIYDELIEINSAFREIFKELGLL